MLGLRFTPLAASVTRKVFNQKIVQFFEVEFDIIEMTQINYFEDSYCLLFQFFAV